MLDININYAEFTDHFYSEVMLVTNWGFVVLAVLPVLITLITKRGKDE